MPTSPYHEPVTLEGRHVRLEPLTLAHVDGLAAVGLDEEIWRFGLTDLRTREDMLRYIETAIREREENRSLPFATVLRSEKRTVGSTRFGNIEPVHRRVEIGWTWIGRPWQRTVVNTEAKLLMLRHAFETLGCVRVELKTSALNQKSRTAIARLGAREEGILCRHMVNDHGVYRDTVYYGILEEEWPAVKSRLEERMKRDA
jgi:RimJ/RimL family protein N-acetyltransferase